MKGKTILLTTTLLLAFVIIVFFINDTPDSINSKQEEAAEATKTIKVNANTLFSYDKVAATYNGENLILVLDDQKVGCNSSQLAKRIKALPPLDLMNNIYVNDNGDFLLAPEKTMIFSTILFRNVKFTTEELKELKETSFEKLSPLTLGRAVSHVYYGARVGESKKVVRTLLKTHPTTKTTLLNFRKNVREINYLDFLPDEYVKLNGTLLFENRVISGKVKKTEIPTLMRTKVNIGTKESPQYGIKLNLRGKEGVEMTVFSCEDLINAFSQRFEAITPEAKAAQRTFYTVFNVLSAVSSHNIATKNFFLDKGLDSLRNIPVTMLPALARSEINALAKHGGAIADFAKNTAAVKIVRAEKEYLHLFYNHAIFATNTSNLSPEDGMELKLTEVMRGDFNSDGLNDIFLQAQMKVPSKTADFFAFMLITLDKKNGLYKQMNIPWK